MIYKFLIADIVIQCESSFPLVISEFDSGFLSDSDKNPDFFISLSYEQFKEPENQKCLFQTDDLIVSSDSNGTEIRYFMFPETKYLYGFSYFSDYNHINAIVFQDAGKLAEVGIPFWNFFMLDQIVYRESGLILHSSYICDGGKAILFSAPSGVGKSTQASLWNFNRKSRIINGDRSLIMNYDGRWIANGFPFHGSSEFCLNESYPIKAIIVLRQDKTNHIELLSVKEKIGCIMTEVICNRWNKDFIFSIMDTVAELIMDVPVYMYYCNMEADAVTCLHDYLEG